MKKILTFIILILILLTACRDILNPIDPESELYIGTPSVDADNDGIGQYEDVDEIISISPINGKIISQLPILLCTNSFNPEKIGKFWIQVATSSNFITESLVYENDQFSTNECTISTDSFFNDTYYYWRAKAYDGSKWSDNWSTVQKFRINIDFSESHVLSPPNGKSTTDTTPILEWTNTTGAKGYHIQVNTNGVFTGTVIADNNKLTASEYPMTTVLADNTTYYWRVKIKNSEGVWGKWNSIWSFKVDIETVALISPKDTTIVTDTTPLLDWADITIATGYYIQVNINENFTETYIVDDDKITFLSSEYNITQTLLNNTTYYWRVKVKNEDGIWGDWCNKYSFTVNLDTVILNLPADSSTIIDTTPVLDWKNVTGATAYQIQLNTNDNFTGTVIIDENTNTDSQYTVPISKVLTDKTTYYWRARIKNEDGVWGDWCSSWSFTIKIIPPAHVSPANSSTGSDTTPTLDWEDMEGATDYQVQLSTNDNFKDTIIVDDNTLTNSQYTVPISKVLADNTTYYWRARVRNEDSIWGDWSSSWSFAIDITPPTLVSPVNSSTGSDTTPTLDWEDIVGATGSQVQLNTNDNFTGTVIIDDNTLTNSQYTVPISKVLADNTTYYWRARVRNEDSIWGDWSSSWSFTINIVPPVLVSPVYDNIESDTTPTFDWENVAGATGYHVQISIGGTELINEIVNEIVNDSEYQINISLTETGPYEWHVSTINTDSVEGEWSESRFFTVETITVTSPNGEVPWMIGTSQTITWDSIGIENVRVELFRNGNWEYIDGGSAITNTGRLIWVVTEPIATDVRIKVRNASGSGIINDESDTIFNISHRVWYVDSSSAGGDGQSWNNAFQNVQDGVDAAIEGEEVWVKAGIYNRVGTERTLLALRTGVHVYGGFAGNETLKDARDWETFETSLYGDDYIYNIVTGVDNARIDGFTIAHGDSTRDGTGLNSVAVGLEIFNCTFYDNESNGDGAAIFLDNGSTVINNCTFYDNESNGDGAAIFLDNGSTVINNCTFNNNTCRGDGGAIYCDFYNGGGTANIYNCIFTLNDVDAGSGPGEGGAISCRNGIISVGNCSFINNEINGTGEDHHGGAIFLERCTATIVSSLFDDNSAGLGGAIYCDMSNASLDIINSVFIGNDATNNGGAIAIEDSDNSQPLTITNCSFSNNKSGNGPGGAIYNYNDSDDVTIVNSIFYHNYGNGGLSQIYNEDTSECSVRYSSIEGDYPGTGNIDDGAGDVNFVNYKSDLHLRSNSVCIDKARGSLAPSTDKDGNSRSGTYVDMGAYEYQP